MGRNTRRTREGTRLVRTRRDTWITVPEGPPFSIRKLVNELHGNPRQRDAIVRRHARLNTQQHVVRCTPGPDECALNAPSIGKVTYDNRKAAARCARELGDLGHEGLTQRPYPCGRGEDGGEHWHLTSRDYLDNEVIPGE